MTDPHARSRQVVLPDVSQRLPENILVADLELDVERLAERLLDKAIALVRFGQRGTVEHNDPVEQEKGVKFTSLLANLVIFHNTLDIADVVRELQAEGRPVDPLDLAQISPYLTERIKRFGEYSTHELGVTPDDYDARLDVDFSILGDDDTVTAA